MQTLLSKLCYFEGFRRLFSIPNRLIGARLDRNANWVFIVGCYNSGTTVLRDTLAQDPRISSPLFEAAFLTSEIITPEELGWVRMWSRAKAEIDSTYQQRGRNEDKLLSDWRLHYDASKLVFLEKSIVNAMNIEWLSHVFPNSKFIHIVRNGYCAAEGIRRKAGKGRYKLPNNLAHYPIEWCAEQWVISLETVINALATLEADRHLTIQYEAFCKTPAVILDDIYKLIGITDTATLDITHIKCMNHISIQNLHEIDVAAINKNSLFVDYMDRLQYVLIDN